MEICDNGLMLWFGKDCEFSLHGRYIREELRIGSWDPMTTKVCSQEGDLLPLQGVKIFVSSPRLVCSVQQRKETSVC